MPDSQHRYLYERLGDHDFQQLVSALLTIQFPDYVPMALRQADGGRDGLRNLDAGKVIVFQVKWSASGKEKNPVSWLDDVVRKEKESLRRLAAAGVRNYFLVTNVASTARPGSGTFDRLNTQLQSYALEFGFDQMTCIWREALNPWVDNALSETKWAYAEMLAGWDLVRYLVAEHVGGAQDRGLRDIIRSVAATQWDDDNRVKFSQSDVDRERVVDLFVDVTAQRIRTPRGTQIQPQSSAAVGGAASYLLRSPAPFVLVRGAPGQGKSTLSQYLCQANRSAFIPEAERLDALPQLNRPRFPIRLDLSDYALWLGGADVWDHSENRKISKGNSRKGEHATLECFIADLMSHDSGGIPVGPKMVQDVFHRIPSLVVLDGLDEVGSPTMREKIVKAIDRFTARGKIYPDPPHVVVTTRPSAGELPEPSPDLFEVIALNQLTVEQRDSYLRKWCAVRDIMGADGRTLRKSFKDKSREPYIHELAGNPMQLTILLDLLHEQGAATPTQRTDLYDKYVELLLAREANKHPKAVRAHKDELLEIVPFLGWYLHAHTEESQINGRMSIADLKAAMRHFQRTYGHRESIVDELFEGASDRLWALTSKLQGTYEFEVLSLREYFAARFLYRNAGEENPAFDATAVLRELLRRPYWLNTVRFYGGNAKGNGIYTLTAGIEQELSENSSTASFLAAWALLTDGVFHRRPREARKVIAALSSDEGLEVLLPALDRRDIVPLSDLPDLPDTDGVDPTWLRLTKSISDLPSDPANSSRVRALRELLNQRVEFSNWWYKRFSEAIGTPAQNEWLRIGSESEAAAGTAVEFGDVDLSDGAAELLLNTGLVPLSGSPLETAALTAILNGECARVTSIRSMPAQVATALSPGAFYTDSKTGFIGRDERTTRRRNDAIASLRKSGSPFAEIARKRVFKVGQKASTFPWADTAAALHEHSGRCWLASEIAIIGGASPFALAYVKRPGATTFGPRIHQSDFLVKSRAHRDDSAWWRRELATTDDDLSRAEWTLAAWGVPSGEVVTDLLPELERVLAQLPSQVRRTVLRAARQVTLSGWLHGRRVVANSLDPELASLLELRATYSPTAALQSLTRAGEKLAIQNSLLSVARPARWLKVDEESVYK